MNKYVAKAKAYWATLDDRKRKIARLVAIAGLVFIVVVLNKLVSN